MRIDSNIQLKVRDAYAARHEPEAARILARMYWALLITFFSLIVASSIAYGVWEFLHMPKEGNALNVRPQVTFTRAQLQSVLQGFDTRAERFQTRMTVPVPVKDPSQ